MPLPQSLVSGGVDSAVCTALLHTALGPGNVIALHIDNGFMRKEESSEVKASLESLGLHPHGNQCCCLLVFGVSWLSPCCLLFTVIVYMCSLFIVRLLSVHCFPVLFIVSCLFPVVVHCFLLLFIVYCCLLFPGVVFQCLFVVYSVYYLLFIVVVNAAVRFYTGTAIISCYDEEGGVQQHVTAPLHAVVSPEEKRKIIGDTFIKVANEAMLDLDLQANQVFLAQGMATVS